MRKNGNVFRVSRVDNLSSFVCTVLLLWRRARVMSMQLQQVGIIIIRAIQCRLPVFLSKSTTDTRNGDTISQSCVYRTSGLGLLGLCRENRKVETVLSRKVNPLFVAMRAAENPKQLQVCLRRPADENARHTCTRMRMKRQPRIGAPALYIKGRRPVGRTASARVPPFAAAASTALRRRLRVRVSAYNVVR